MRFSYLSKLTDEELMFCFSTTENSEAFETLFQRYEERILQYFKRKYKLKDINLAEDLTQESFHNLIKGKSNYKPTGKF